MRGPLVRVALLWAGVLLAAPAILSWTGFGTAPSAENRAASPLPDRARPQDAAWFGEMTAYIEDRLALSANATALLRRFDLDVAGRLPVSDVIVGSDDFLFLRKSLEAPCLEDMGLEAERELLEALEAAAGRLSMRVVLAVVPDKVAVVTDHVPAAFRARAECLRERAFTSEALARDILGTNALPVATLLDTDPPSYFRQDTHWTPQGRLAVLETLVDTIAPGMWDPAAVQSRPDERTLDLRVLAGTPETIQVEDNALRFAAASDVEGWPDLERAVTVTGRAAPGQRLIEDRTLFIHDSFVAAWRGEFKSLFSDAVFLHWDEIREPPVIELFEGRDLLVLELVGRSYWGDSERIRRLLDLLTKLERGT